MRCTTMTETEIVSRACIRSVDCSPAIIAVAVGLLLETAIRDMLRYSSVDEVTTYKQGEAAYPTDQSS